MKDKRLAQYIRQNKEASRIYHKFLSLPLLPGMHISDSFQLLTEDLGKLNALDRFKSFIKYFENQWMQKVQYSFLHKRCYDFIITDRST